MPSNIQNATSVCRSRTVVSDVLDRVKGVYQPAYVSIAGGKLMALLVSLFITLIVLLICREIVCWYWKINEALTTLKAIDEKLSVQINILHQVAAEESVSSIRHAAALALVGWYMMMPPTGRVLPDGQRGRAAHAMGKSGRRHIATRRNASTYSIGFAGIRTRRTSRPPSDITTGAMCLG